MANQTYPVITLGNVLSRCKNETFIQELETYARLTIRMNGQGVILRDRLLGSQIGTKKQFVSRSGQFILSKIDARNGAFGIVPEECDKAIITGNFWAFNVDHARLEARFFEYLTKTPLFVDFCIRASEGTTNRLYLQETDFLAQKIVLPPLEEQRRIVARIEELVTKVEEAWGLRSEAVEEASVLVRSTSSHVFSSNEAEFSSCQIGEVIDFRNELIRPIDGKSGSLRFIGLQHIESHTGKRIGEDRLLAEELTGRKFRFSPGELVYGYLRPYLNKVWVADCNGVCSVDQYVIQPKSELVDTWYLAHFMKSQTFLTQAIELTHSLILPRLRSGLLESILIPLPSLFEQRRIIAYLDDLQTKVDRLKRLQSETEAELNALLPSILDKAFKGEL